jgi:uncharacterized DUF497 family protein
MDGLKFDWDPGKAATNRKKQGVSFEEARTVFFDDYARLIVDPEHSEHEERFILLGFSAQLRLLVVSHTYREDGQIIRIISARNAKRAEQQQYEGFRYER